ncbi:MAG TPA: hypothetical protein VF590_21385 [Isosphaeraceae bacterium]|jgi:hypothetical protein
MGTMELLRAVFIIGPIVGLFVLGFWLTLRSGVMSLGTGQGLRQFLGNLSQTIVLLAGYVAGMAVIQQVVGFNFGLM